MDWYAWLCKAGLDPDLAYEYALLFERNELGAADVRHLDHDFLASMGVAVAKHRLEILKLARKESSRAAAITVLPWRATRLLAAAVHRSAQSLAGYIRSVARRDRAAVAVAPRPPRPLCHRGGGRGAAQWKRSASSVARRSSKLGFLKHESRPMLTNRGAKRNGATTDKAAAAAAIAGCFAGPETCSTYNDADEDDEEEMDGSEEMPWESMFQDLKPT